MDKFLCDFSPGKGEADSTPWHNDYLELFKKEQEPVLGKGKSIYGQLDSPAPLAPLEPQKPIADAKETIEKLNAALPEGKRIQASEFIEKAGPEAASAISWANPKALTRTGNHYKIECENGSSFSNEGVTVHLKNPVEFDLKALGNSVNASSVNGVKVSLAGIKVASVKEATITPNPDGSATVTGKAQISVLLPSIPFSFTLAKPKAFLLVQ